MNNVVTVRFPKNFQECQSLSDVDSAVNSGDYFSAQVRVVRVKSMMEEEFEDFSTNLNAEYSWANISADLSFAGPRPSDVDFDAVEISYAGHNKFVHAAVSHGALLNVGVI